MRMMADEMQYHDARVRPVWHSVRIRGGGDVLVKVEGKRPRPDEGIFFGVAFPSDDASATYMQ